MTSVNAYATQTARGKLERYSFTLGPLEPEQLDIDVIACGICHSDLSMANNDWHITTYPFVPGHEVIGKVSAVGSNVKGLKIGDTVGLGWYAESCMYCDQCMHGDHNLCGSAIQTIVGRHGGFADKVRAHWSWAIKLPEELDVLSAGPLFCGGITVFNPIVVNNIKPTDKVGVIGIGGLGHLALQFLNKWGCDVTAFTSTGSKAEEAKALGAHHIVDSRDPEAIKAVAGKYDFILSTVNVTLPWELYIGALRPKGKLHIVGAVPDPIPVQVMSLIMANRAIVGSPLGSPAVTRDMLAFCARHEIKPQIEVFPMSKVNEAFDHLEAGKARYRIILQNDF